MLRITDDIDVEIPDDDQLVRFGKNLMQVKVNVEDRMSNVEDRMDRFEKKMEDRFESLERMMNELLQLHYNDGYNPYSDEPFDGDILRPPPPARRYSRPSAHPTPRTNPTGSWRVTIVYSRGHSKLLEDAANGNYTAKEDKEDMNISSEEELAAVLSSWLKVLLKAIEADTPRRSL
ncbi:hypothetical protein C0992_005103, partial [Termitomyces sp. T32_za158]